MGGAGACVGREVLVEARVGHGRRRAVNNGYTKKTHRVPSPVGQPEAAGDGGRALLHGELGRVEAGVTRPRPAQ